MAYRERMMFHCACLLCPWVLQIYFEHNLSCALYAHSTIWEGSNYFPFLGGSLATLYLWAEWAWWSVQLKGASKEAQPVFGPVSIQLCDGMRTRSLDLFQIWIQCHAGITCWVTLQPDSNCSVQASMTLRAAGEWKQSKSTVVANLSLHQTNRRALGLQNNQQPAKRLEQTPAGCHSEEQTPFLKK